MISAARRLAQRRPVLCTAVPLVVLFWVASFALLLARQDPTPALLIGIAFFILVPLTVSWLIGGWAEVRRLFAGVLRFRFSVALWAVVLFGVPLLSLAVATVTGTLRTPPDGWVAVLVTYLVSTLVVGGLIANVWEETAWGGMVQGRLMASRGLLVGSLLTAVPFALFHLPLAFSQKGLFDTPLNEALATWGILIGLAPVFRYLIGLVLIETGGSTLAAGLLHASWNASGQIAAFDGSWQYIPAVFILVLGIVAWRRARHLSLVSGFAPQLGPSETPTARA